MQGVGVGKREERRERAEGKGRKGWQGREREMHAVKSDSQIAEKGHREDKERRRMISRETKEVMEAQTYDPWGKQGAGAPLRDEKGEVVADIRSFRGVSHQRVSGSAQGGNTFSVEVSLCVRLLVSVCACICACMCALLRLCVRAFVHACVFCLCALMRSLERHILHPKKGARKRAIPYSDALHSCTCAKWRLDFAHAHHVSHDCTRMHDCMLFSARACVLYGYACARVHVNACVRAHFYVSMCVRTQSLSPCAVTDITSYT